MAQNAGPEEPESERQGTQSQPGMEQEDQADEERESIWSIPVSLKRLYFGLFTTQIAIAVAWLIRTAIVDESTIGVSEKVLSVWQGMAPMAVSSAAFALTITDTWKTSMVLGTYLEEVLKKRRQKSIAEAVKKGLDEGRKEGLNEGLNKGRKEGLNEGLKKGVKAERQRWLEWNRRREAAVAVGEEFTEPPPSATTPESTSTA